MKSHSRIFVPEFERVTLLSRAAVREQPAVPPWGTLDWTQDGLREMPFDLPRCVVFPSLLHPSQFVQQPILPTDKLDKQTHATGLGLCMAIGPSYLTVIPPQLESLPLFDPRYRRVWININAKGHSI
jgi:hypothetical protein